MGHQGSKGGGIGTKAGFAAKTCRLTGQKALC
jgi:hypothetical protein